MQVPDVIYTIVNSQTGALPNLPTFNNASVNRGLQIPYHSHNQVSYTFTNSQKLSYPSFSTYATVDSQSSAISDMMVPERFLFSAVKKSKKSHLKLTNPLKTKSKNSSKKKLLEQLPLLDALRKRNLPTMRELYGTFSEYMGNGASGNVRSTYSLRDGKKYAVKTYKAKREGQKEKQYFERISNEIYIGASMSHPNIIRTIDVVMEQGQIHQIMEFCPSDLCTIIKSGEASAKEISKYFVQMMEGLNYLHHRGVAHRDLKLENLCVDEDEVLKIIDFGSSFIVTNPLDLFQQKSATSFVGTDPYIAPEIQAKKRYDATKADIWSAGIVFIAMALRKFPWKAALSTDKNYSSFLQHREKEKFFGVLPTESVGLIRKMLDPNPDTRLTVNEVFEDPWFQSIRNQLLSNS